jgi:fatty-acid desaturase
MLWFFLSYYLVAVLGVNLGYHRMLAHRSVRLRGWLARACVVCGLPAGTPVQWAGNHRFHHAHSDTELDPHSPGRGGFWHAHCGWYYGLRHWPVAALYALAGPARLLIDAWLRPRTGVAHNHLAEDVAADPFYAWLSRPAPYACGMGLPFAAVALYNLGDAIDSVAHDAKGPVNRRWLAILTAGEGWHIEHHERPGCARHGRRPGQFDLTWLIIRLLAGAGWANVEQEHGSA